MSGIGPLDSIQCANHDPFDQYAGSRFAPLTTSLRRVLPDIECRSTIAADNALTD